MRYAWDVNRDYHTTRRRLAPFMQGAEGANPDRQVLIISRSNIPYLIKAHALMAKALQLRGYWPVIVTSSNNHLASKYFKLFGIEDIVYWDVYAQQHQPRQSDVDGVVRSFLESRPSIQEIKQWNLRGVYAAKHALSTAIRTALRGQFDLDNPEQLRSFESHLKQAVASMLVAERLYDSRPIVKAIVRDAGYTPNGALYEVGLRRGVDCVRAEMGQLRGSWLMKRYTPETIGRALFSLSEDTWERLRHNPLTAEQETELEGNYADRYDPTSQKDMYKYQVGKQQMSADTVRERLGLDPRKQTAVIFSHITWDASFFDGEDLYDDYEHWLVATVRAACRNPSLNWVVKLHPANVFKLKREGSITENQETEMLALRQLGPLPDHVRILHADTDINTWSLFPLIDYGVTVRGTIGMELPMYGVPVLTAGTGRYDGFGFTIDSQSQEEYEERLRHLHEVPRLDALQMELAHRHCYWLLVRHQVSFEDIAPATAMMVQHATHPLHYNLQIRASSLRDLESSPSFSAFADWFLESDQPDFMR